MRKFTLFLLTAITFLTACNPTLSEAGMQTAVAEAMLTSAAELPTQVSNTSQDIEHLEGELDSAIAALTQQAERISELEAQLETEAFIPTSTITRTPIFTSTPIPFPTATSGLPSNMKIVVAKGNTPLWYYEHENDVGRPIMIKTRPIIRYEEGDWFIVYIPAIRADGGGYFYQIAGPTNQGYFVEVDDVRDQD